MPKLLVPNYMELEFILRLLVACMLGTVIGLERTSKYKSAGIRTYIIVAVCAAIFTMVSKYGFLDIAAEKTRVDVSRVAHTIVTGVSFLGGGVIFSKGDRVLGIKTAAGIWVMAAIGIACGTGMYTVAFIATGLVLIAQTLLIKWIPMDYKIDGEIVANLDDSEESLKEFETFLKDKKIEIFGAHIKHQEGNRMTYTFKVRVPEPVNIVAMSTIIAGRQEVKGINFFKK